MGIPAPLLLGTHLLSRQVYISEGGGRAARGHCPGSIHPFTPFHLIHVTSLSAKGRRGDPGTKGSKGTPGGIGERVSEATTQIIANKPQMYRTGKCVMCYGPVMQYPFDIRAAPELGMQIPLCCAPTVLLAPGTVSFFRVWSREGMKGSKPQG